MKYSLNGDTPSSFFKAELINIEDVKEDDWRINGISAWETILVSSLIKKGIAHLPGDPNENNSFTRNGIAYEFSRLKTESDIDQFAKKNGNLGITVESKMQALTLLAEYEVYKDAIYIFLPHGPSNFVPLEIWKYQINQVRNILQLYKAFVNIHNGTEKNQIKGDLLNIGEKYEDHEAGFDKYESGYFVEWYDGTQTGCVISIDTAKKGDFLQIAKEVLIESIGHNVKKMVTNIEMDTIETEEPPLGFFVQERKVTKYLIDAIYYDLWNLISKNEPVHICENPNCKLPFKMQKRQKYCSNACKQEAYRIRKESMK